MTGNVDLHERELHKMEALTSALARRGIDPTTAALAAEDAVSVFRRSFAAWIADASARLLGDHQRGVLSRLQALLASGWA